MASRASSGSWLVLWYLNLCWGRTLPLTSRFPEKGRETERETKMYCSEACPHTAKPHLLTVHSAVNWLAYIFTQSALNSVVRLAGEQAFNTDVSGKDPFYLICNTVLFIMFKVLALEVVAMGSQWHQWDTRMTDIYYSWDKGIQDLQSRSERVRIPKAFPFSDPN